MSGVRDPEQIQVFHAKEKKVSPLGGTVDDIGITVAYMKSRPYLSQLSRTISMPMSFGTWVRIS